MTRQSQGVLAILPAVFAMALTDAIVKNWSDEISLWQIWVVRSFLVLPVLYVMARGRSGWPARAGSRCAVWR